MNPATRADPWSIHGDARLLPRLANDRVERALARLDGATRQAVAAPAVVLLDEQQAAVRVESRRGRALATSHTPATAAAIGPGQDTIGSVERTTFTPAAAKRPNAAAASSV